MCWSLRNNITQQSDQLASIRPGAIGIATSYSKFDPEILAEYPSFLFENCLENVDLVLFQNKSPNTAPTALSARGADALHDYLVASPSHHHINLAAAAFRADQPVPPLGNGHFGGVALSLFGGIGLDLMAAISAPHDEANAGSSRTA